MGLCEGVASWYDPLVADSPLARLRSPLMAMVAVAIGVTGCAEQPRSLLIDGDPQLRVMGNCAALSTELRERAYTKVDADADRLLAYFARIPPAIPGSTPLPTPAATPLPLATPTPGPTDFTTTNVQERDVDEADILKNDGQRIFYLHKGRVLKLSSWPAADTRVEWVTTVEGTPSQMLIFQDRLVVFSSVPANPLLSASGLPTRAPCTSPFGCFSATAMTTLDVGGPEPRVERVRYIEGSFLSARRVGSVVRAVTRAGLALPQLTQFPETPVASASSQEWNAAIETMRKRNRAAIRDADPIDWLPREMERSAGGAVQPLATDCSSYSAGPLPVALGTTHVTSFDLGRPNTTFVSDALLAPGARVYANNDALYVTAPHDWSLARASGAPLATEEHTYLHLFEFQEDSLHARPVAMGGVAGWVNDQFAMSAVGHQLRVATQRQRVTEAGVFEPTTSAVAVLLRRGDRLELAGEVQALAPGERLFAARFIGDRGFIVTFRQVDPFFTFDLRRPDRPLLAGELKMPGFSTYLHPLSDTEILGIGRDADLSGVARGLLLQVFDVSDLANPRLVSRLPVGSNFSNSQASWDHKAFNHFPARSLLAIPFSDYNLTTRFVFRSSIEVFSTIPGQPLAAVASFDHTDLQALDPCRFCSSWTPYVSRSIMADDFVYSISTMGLKVHDLRQPMAPVAVVRFP